MTTGPPFDPTEAGGSPPPPSGTEVSPPKPGVDAPRPGEPVVPPSDAAGPAGTTSARASRRGARAGRRSAGAVGALLVRRYWAPVVVIVGAVLLVNLLPSASKTKTTGQATASAPSGITPANAAGGSGTAVSGIQCAPGVRQVPWSHYAPLCEPRWAGHNGGATAPGVTSTTITLTYREASSSELSLLNSIVPSSVIGTNTEAISTMQAFVNTFNKNFELYGRHVVLKPFVGKGDFISELNGEDQAGAQEDAVTAKSLGAFADSSVLDATPIYEQALAGQGVVGMSIYGGPDSQFAQNAPYEYTTGTVCSKSAAEAEQYVGRVLNTTPSSFAGSATLNGKKRVFGYIGPATAQSERCNAAVIATLKAKYGITMKDQFSMSLSTTAESQAASVMGQMHSDGVTTVLCQSCDFFTPIFLTKAATAIGYRPEWVETNFVTALTALQTPAQIADAEGFGLEAPAKERTEAYHAFELGASPGSQLIPTYSYLYKPLLLFFDSLQAAGPDLTPVTFQKGLRSLPASIPHGMYGTWAFTTTSVDPNASYGMVKWSNTAASALDGKPGAWLSCNDARQYRLDGSPPQLPVGKPLDCPDTGG